MAKNMALLEDGTVVNILWCSDGEPETDTLKNSGDYPVAIGDTYTDGQWLRDGMELLTPLEEAEQKNAALAAELADAKEALAILGVAENE